MNVMQIILTVIISEIVRATLHMFLKFCKRKMSKSKTKEINRPLPKRCG